MGKINLSAIAKSVKAGLIEHSPEILAGVGIAGMITAGIMAVRVTPKALDLINDIREEVPEDDKKGFAKEFVKKVAPIYIPAVLTEGFSVACIIGAMHIKSRRNTALFTAYTLSENALREYQEKVIETIGEKKEKAIQDEIYKDKVKANPVTNSEVIVTGSGSTLCYDSISGRYFTSDIEKIRHIQNELNMRLINEMYISLNEVYYELGLQCTELGNQLGFNINDGLIDFHYTSEMAADGRPCLAIGYHIAPRYGYSDLS